MKANRTVTDVDASFLDEEGLRLIQTDLLPILYSPQSSSEISQVNIAPTVVFTVSILTNFSAKVFSPVLNPPCH